MNLENREEISRDTLAIVGCHQEVVGRVVRHLVDAMGAARTHRCDFAGIQIDDLESAVAVSTGDLVRTNDRHSVRSRRACRPGAYKAALPRRGLEAIGIYVEGFDCCTGAI